MVYLTFECLPAPAQGLCDEAWSPGAGVVPQPERAQLRAQITADAPQWGVPRLSEGDPKWPC